MSFALRLIKNQVETKGLCDELLDISSMREISYIQFQQPTLSFARAVLELMDDTSFKMGFGDTADQLKTFLQGHILMGNTKNVLRAINSVVAFNTTNKKLVKLFILYIESINGLI